MPSLRGDRASFRSRLSEKTLGRQLLNVEAGHNDNHAERVATSECHTAWFHLLARIQEDGRGCTLTWKLFMAGAAGFMRHVTDAAIVAERVKSIAGGEERLPLCQPLPPIGATSLDLQRCPPDRADAARLVRAFTALQPKFGFIATCEALFAVGCSVGVEESGTAAVRTYLFELAKRYADIAARQSAWVTWH